MSDASRLKSTIHVSSLPAPCTAVTLHSAFLPFGEIVDVTLPANDAARSGQHHGDQAPSDGSQPHRGFGYIEFADPSDAVEAIENMDQSELFGKVIRVSHAKERKDKDRNEGLGSRTALWQQVCYSVLCGASMHAGGGR